MDLESIQDQLAQMKIDAWLMYDFQGINPIAAEVAGLRGKHLTRRWFCLVPAHGDPRWLVSELERSQFSGLEGDLHTYFSWTTLREGLEKLLQGSQRLAMEYAPHGTIPYVSRVDAGTMEMVRSMNVTVVSSADLVQWCQARLSPSSLALHLQASKHLYAALERGFHLISQSVLASRKISEYDVQQEIVRYLEVNDLETDTAPIVAATENTNDPHYLPDEHRSVLIEEGDLVLIDLWAKMRAPDAVYADITWMAYVGDQVPDDFARVFTVLTRARDVAMEFVRSAVAGGEVIRGYQVDDVARSIVAEEGYGEKFIHRTGHSLGTQVHGRGVNFDNLEDPDERAVIPDIACTIEPGIYLRPFGMRTEIDIYVGERKAEITTLPVQRHILALLTGD